MKSIILNSDQGEATIKIACIYGPTAQLIESSKREPQGAVFETRLRQLRVKLARFGQCDFGDRFSGGQSKQKIPRSDSN